MPKAKITALPCEETVQDGDIEIRLFGQFNTEIHSHEKAQLISPELGTVYLYSEKGSFCIPAGHYAFISSGIKHKLVSRSQRLRLKTIFLEMAKEAYAEDWGAVTIFPSSILLDNLLSFGEAHWFNPGNENLKIACLTTLKQMLPYMFKQTLNLCTQPPRSEELLRVTEHVTNFLSENLTISALSKIANMPERTLSRMFKRETGMTIFQFIKLRRMQMALELMENQTLNINEIVYSIGYESVSTFSNLFKEMIGMSPQKYRQSYLKRH